MKVLTILFNIVQAIHWLTSRVAQIHGNNMKQFISIHIAYVVLGPLQVFVTFNQLGWSRYHHARELPHHQFSGGDPTVEMHDIKLMEKTVKGLPLLPHIRDCPCQHHRVQHNLPQIWSVKTRIIQLLLPRSCKFPRSSVIVYKYNKLYKSQTSKLWFSKLK